MNLKDRFFADGKVDDCPIFDMHGHWGKFYGGTLPYADIESTKKHFDASGVRLLVFCHHDALMSGDITNQINEDAVSLWPERMRAYCGINPHYQDRIAHDLATFDSRKDSFVGFKMLADYHQVPVEDDRFKSVWEFADANKLPVLMHTWGGSIYDGFENVKAVCERYPNAQKLLGHSIHSDLKGAVTLATEYPNVYLELCAILDARGEVEHYVEHVGSDKIIYGTDYPWFSEHYYTGALLGAGLADDDIRNILYRNAQKILNGLVPAEFISAP